MTNRPQSRGSRSQHRKGRRPRRTPRPAVTTLRDHDAQIVAAPKVAPPPTPKEMVPDYSYVYRDLRSIGLIVGGIVIVYLIIYFTWK